MLRRVESAKPDSSIHGGFLFQLFFKASNGNLFRQKVIVSGGAVKELKVAVAFFK